MTIESPPYRTRLDSYDQLPSENGCAIISTCIQNLAEKPNTSAPHLWVQGPALVAAFGRFWPLPKRSHSPFSYGMAATGRFEGTSLKKSTPRLWVQGHALVAAPEKITLALQLRNGRYRPLQPDIVQHVGSPIMGPGPRPGGRIRRCHIFAHFFSFCIHFVIKASQNWCFSPTYSATESYKM